jgi:hypothetical protein
MLGEETITAPCQIHEPADLQLLRERVVKHQGRLRTLKKVLRQRCEIIP